MKKKLNIGILTMNYDKNYGGVLQCLALQNTLIEMGHEVRVIRFSKTRKNGFFRKFLILLDSFERVDQYLNFIADLYRDFSRRVSKKKGELPQSLLDNFALFVKDYINYTEVVNEDNIGSIAKEFDIIFVGSDKIWTGMTKTKLTYFFDWNPDFTGTRVSYAACSSDAKIPFIVRSKAKRLLSKFDMLSVRDSNTFKYVKKTCGREATITVDPTLLYDFRDFIDKKNDESEPYIFAYILGDSIKGGHGKVIELLKKKYGKIKIKAIVIADESIEAESFADEVIYDASPQLWFKLIKGATFVYTDSFHGCIFSLKYRKQFLGYYTYAHRATRLIDLKNRYGVSNNIVSSINEVIKKESINKEIDYDLISLVIEDYRSESIEYLNRCLEQAKIDHTRKQNL